MPYRDLEVRKAYHKKYNREWERRTKRYQRPERKAYCKSLYKSGSTTAYMRMILYGITPEMYQERRKKQKNRCALCGRKEHRIHYKTGKRQSLSVDHNHETGKVRELLCRDCNLGLGMFQHCPNLLLKAIKYLNKHKGSNQ